MWGLKKMASGSCSRYDEDSVDETPFKAIVDELEHEDPLHSEDDTQTLLDQDESEDEEDVGEMIKAIKEKGKRKKKKAVGRKSKFSLTELADLTDVICSDPNFRKKLIFMNVTQAHNAAIYEKIVAEMSRRAEERGESFAKTVHQTRTKFKRMIAFCKKKALARITATGVEDIIGATGDWFKTLFPLVQSRESADPDNGREPSYDNQHEDGNNSNNNNESGVLENGEKSTMFVPSRPKNKRQKKEEILIDAIKTFQVLASDQTKPNQNKELVEFLEKDNEKNRLHEQQMLEMQLRHQREMMQMMMMSMSQRPAPQPIPNSSANMTWPNMYTNQ